MPYSGTKQRIFDVSVKLFSEKGYDAVSLREIAAEVGITNAAIYNHFNSKEAILNDIFAAFKRKLDGYILKKAQVDRYIETDTPRQLLERCIGRFVESDMEFMAYGYRITYREYLNSQLASELIIVQLHERTAKSIQYVLDSLIRRGSIPAMDTWSFALLWTQSMFSAAAIWVFRLFGGAALEASEVEYNVVSERLVEMALSGKVQ